MNQSVKHIFLHEIPDLIENSQTYLTFINLKNRSLLETKTKNLYLIINPKVMSNLHHYPFVVDKEPESKSNKQSDSFVL